MADRYTSTPGDQIRDGTIKKDELDLTNTPTDGQIIKINMPTGDFTAIDNKASDLDISGQTAEDFLIYDGSNWVAKGGTELVKVGTFSRADLSVTGTQAITGVGFKPKTLYIMGYRSGDGRTACWSFTDGTTHGGLVNQSNVTVGSITRHAFLIFLDLDGSNDARAVLTSFDSDGFTLTWTKGGSPTGAATFTYWAFR